jgi:hypothetical protein
MKRAWIGMGLSVFVLAAITHSSFGAPGSSTIRDPDDTAGRLDIRFISHWRSDGLLRHRVTMFTAWDNDTLSRNRHWVAIRISTATRQVQCCSYVAWVRHSRDKGLFATIHRIEGDQIIRVGRARVRRGSSRSVLVSFPGTKIGLSDGGRYRWSGESSLETSSGPCSSDVAVEDAFPAPGTCWDWTDRLSQRA